MFKNRRCYSSIYIDDIIVIGDTYKECLIGTIKIIRIFLKLGFIRHPEKSSLQPSQDITYLGFVFNSKEMWVTFTNAKREKLFESCKGFLKKGSSTMKKLSSLIETLASTFPGNKFEPLCYRELDKCKKLGFSMYLRVAFDSFAVRFTFIFSEG